MFVKNLKKGENEKTALEKNKANMVKEGKEMRG